MTARLGSTRPGLQPAHFLAIADRHVSRRPSDVGALAAVDQGTKVRVLNAPDIQPQKIVAATALDFRIDDTPARRGKKMA